MNSDQRLPGPFTAPPAATEAVRAAGGNSLGTFERNVLALLASGAAAWFTWVGMSFALDGFRGIESTIGLAVGAVVGAILGYFPSTTS